MSTPPEYGDWDELPDDQRITRERLEELLDAGAPEWFDRYRDLLARPATDRCRMAIRGLGGLYWPCVRPTAAGERYCFAHGGRSPEAR